jgi:hypothetical protein
MGALFDLTVVASDDLGEEASLFSELRRSRPECG